MRRFPSWTFSRFTAGFFSLFLLCGAVVNLRPQATPAEMPVITLASTSIGLKPLFDALVPVYAEIGLRAVYVELPAGRLNKDATDGLIDAVIAVSEGFQKTLSANYLAIGLGKDPLGASNLCMYVRKGDEGKYQADPLSWKGLTVGVIVSVGPTMTDAYLKNVAGITVMTAPTYPSLAKMLDGGRFDFFLSTQGAVEPDIAELQLKDRIVRLDKVLMSLRYYHALNKRFQAKAAELSVAMLRHRTEIDRAVNDLINK